MNNLWTFSEEYLTFCEHQKRLNSKTLAAYRTDLKQFCQLHNTNSVLDINASILEDYISHLHDLYKPKTVKRKLASLKSFFHYLEYKELLDRNPFDKVYVKFREPVILPKTIPLYALENLLSTVYNHQNSAGTIYQRRNAIRDAAVIELLFATGIRISELCSLNIHDVNLHSGIILIHGKGSKERCMHIGNRQVLSILSEYKKEFFEEIQLCNHFFANQSGRPLSDQSVRRIINKYTSLASIELHITPHMFRHTFATCLLEADVDIRYIQEMLGHSSINITEIYTHVAMSKKKDILTTKHPRKDFHL